MNNLTLENDSLVFSEAIDEVNLLLSDEMEEIPTVSRYHRPKQIELESKGQKQNQFKHYIETNPSICLYYDMQLQKSRNGVIKTNKKLAKEKQNFLKFDPRIQQISLKEMTKAQRINELSSIIQSEKIVQSQKRLKNFMQQLIQIADDLLSQKKSLQRDLENLVEINKLLSSKLMEILKLFTEGKFQRTSASKNAYSFSKNNEAESDNSFFQNYHFAKTVIGSIQQLELRKVEEEEGISIAEVPMVELIWVFKNKLQGNQVHLSEGLLERIASGPTLKSWIRKIQNKFGCPNISQFNPQIEKQQQNTTLQQFIELLQQNQEHFISNIKSSKQPTRQLQLLKYSSMMTFSQILTNEHNKYSKEGVLAELGNMNRVLKLISKKLKLQKIQEQQVYTSKNIIQLIQTIF